MKEYYINERMSYCYPFEVSKNTKNYGVLNDYIGKYYTQEEIDEIICEMIKRHPYIENSMKIEIIIERKVERYVNGKKSIVRELYHILDFKNYNYKNQKRGGTEINYEKI